MECTEGKELPLSLEGEAQPAGPMAKLSLEACWNYAISLLMAKRAKLEPAGHAAFLENAAEVVLHRVFLQRAGGGDFLVRLAGYHEADQLQLSLVQAELGVLVVVRDGRVITG